MSGSTGKDDGGVKNERLNPPIELLDLYVKICDLVRVDPRLSLDSVATTPRRSNKHVNERLGRLQSLYRDAIDESIAKDTYLINYTKNCWHISDAGESLYKAARIVVDAHAEIRAWPNVADAPKEARPELVVAATSLSVAILAPAIVAFSRLEPIECDLRFIEATSREDVVKLVRDGVAAMGLVEYTDAKYPRVESEPLDITYELHAVCGEGVKLGGDKKGVDIEDLKSRVVCATEYDRGVVFEGIERVVARLIAVTSYDTVASICRSNADIVGIMPLIPGIASWGLQAKPFNSPIDGARWRLGFWRRSGRESDWAPYEAFKKCVLDVVNHAPDPGTAEAGRRPRNRKPLGA